MNSIGESSKKTPSEILIECLEEFGKAEPSEVIVVWTDETNAIRTSGVGRSVLQLLGMLEAGKIILATKIQSTTEDET